MVPSSLWLTIFTSQRTWETIDFGLCRLQGPVRATTTIRIVRLSPSTFRNSGECVVRAAGLADAKVAFKHDLKRKGNRFCFAAISNFATFNHLMQSDFLSHTELVNQPLESPCTKVLCTWYLVSFIRSSHEETGCCQWSHMVQRFLTCQLPLFSVCFFIIIIFDKFCLNVDTHQCCGTEQWPQKFPGPNSCVLRPFLKSTFSFFPVTSQFARFTSGTRKTVPVELCRIMGAAAESKVCWVTLPQWSWHKVCAVN